MLFPLDVVGDAEREIRYPHIVVNLLGESSDGAKILMRTRHALRKGGVPSAEIAQFQTEALEGGTYNDLIRTVSRWVTTY